MEPKKIPTPEPCPFCDGKYAKKSIGAWHSAPACPKFIELSAGDFLAAAEKRRAAEKPAG